MIIATPGRPRPPGFVDPVHPQWARVRRAAAHIPLLLAAPLYVANPSAVLLALIAYVPAVAWLALVERVDVARLRWRTWRKVLVEWHAETGGGHVVRVTAWAETLPDAVARAVRAAALRDRPIAAAEPNSKPLSAGCWVGRWVWVQAWAFRAEALDAGLREAVALDEPALLRLAHAVERGRASHRRIDLNIANRHGTIWLMPIPLRVPPPWAPPDS